MPRRRVLTGAQLESLIALPQTEPVLVRHWTLDEADLVAIARRRGGGNRLGYALQLCAFRYPGRLLRPGEVLPQPALDFVAEQIHVTAGELATYAARRQTRQEQLDDLRETFGFGMYGPDQAREVSTWLLPVALATTDIPSIAATLMDEFRRRRVIAPGPTVIERLVAAVLVSAERHVTDQLTRGLSPHQMEALDSVLMSDEGAATSVLAWARQPPGAPNHKALKRTVDQLIRLRAVGLDPACAEGVHPERLRKLAREGGRFDHVRQGGGELLGVHRGLLTGVRLRCGSRRSAARRCERSLFRASCSGAGVATRRSVRAGWLRRAS